MRHGKILSKKDIKALRGGLKEMEKQPQIPNEDLIPNEMEECPVCKSKDIGNHYISNGVMGPEYTVYTDYYYCNKCGVMLAPQVMDKKNEE